MMETNSEYESVEESNTEGYIDAARLDSDSETELNLQIELLLS